MYICLVITEVKRSRVEHYCPKVGPIFISAWLLQRSRIEHYCPLGRTYIYICLVITEVKRSIVEHYCPKA
jgi:hypothetical protein